MFTNHVLFMPHNGINDSVGILPIDKWKVQLPNTQYYTGDLKIWQIIHLLSNYQILKPVSMYIVCTYCYTMHHCPGILPTVFPVYMRECPDWIDIVIWYSLW